MLLVLPIVHVLGLSTSSVAASSKPLPPKSTGRVHASPAEISLTELLSTCIDAAARGAAEIRRVHLALQRDGDTVQEVDYKIAGDPRSALTAADLAAQAVVTEALECAWPGLRIVGEEDVACSVDSDAAGGSVCASAALVAGEDGEQPAGESSPQLRRDLCSGMAPEDCIVPLRDVTVFVDPLDGTREFVEGRVWNVQTLIGVAVNGEAVAGAVGLPFASGSADSEAAVVYALPGHGPPRVYGTRAPPDDSVHGGGVPAEGARPLLVAGDAGDAALDAAYNAALAEGGRRVLLGGTGQKCLAVAEGRADVAVMNFQSSSWDTCAPEAIVRAAGGEVTDLFGQRLIYRPSPRADDASGYLNACGVVASSKAHVRTHARLCAAMRADQRALRRLVPWGLERGDDDEVTAVLRRRCARLLDGLAPSAAPAGLATVLGERDHAEPELSRVLLAAANACARVSEALRTHTLSHAAIASRGGGTNVQGEAQQGMDVVANTIFVEELAGVVAAMASEEEEALVAGELTGGKYTVAFDPLDGSANLEPNLPTGSIFGVYKHVPGTDPFAGKGRDTLVAAGYALYSASTELVLSLASGTTCVGFTLDPSRRAFRSEPYEHFALSRPAMACPPRGPYYSLNDAREPDWPTGLKRWVGDAKAGATPSGTKFSARYVCALVADAHRTFLRGGWAGNPRPHLRVLYEALPLAHIAAACGGKATDGVRDILDLEPDGLHGRTPLFLGSASDIDELVAYGAAHGGVQQGATAYASDGTPVGLASLQRLLALTDREWSRIARNVPEVAELVSSGPGSLDGWSSLRRLQARAGLSDGELKAVVLRLPQLLGDDYDRDVAPPLDRLQAELELSDEQLRTLVTKLPQVLGLGFDEHIQPKLAALRVECDGRTCRKLSTGELREKLLAKPSALGVAVRGAFRTSTAEEASGGSA